MEFFSSGGTYSRPLVFSVRVCAAAYELWPSLSALFRPCIAFCAVNLANAIRYEPADRRLVVYGPSARVLALKMRVGNM